eukprot:TRINITY_DN17942_c0_g1_i1.p1 TRINITY_DN17942_c0_g1~~TRINITY_DN17942_c0_g1_i1.p1  ORF type:complete len:324 (+),score=45.48 TRINITY_DN17942_c0_g1_i1:3-974(+)
MKTALFWFCVALCATNCFGKIGFAITGAASKIGQEAALIQALVEGHTPSGKKIIPDLITGASSGSLSAAALNAVLSTKNNFSFADYYDLLGTFRNGDVFDTTTKGWLEIFSYNLEHGFVLSTAPLRKYLAKMLEEWKFETLGDLPIPTIISVVNKTDGTTHRLSSLDPVHSKFPLVDVLMSSTAIPGVFPPRSIPGYTDEAILIDGGTGVDNLPIIPMLESTNPRVDEIYCITHQSNMTKPSGILADLPIALNFWTAIEILKHNSVMDGLNIGRQVTDRKIYSYIPFLPTQFFGLDFDTEQQQFIETYKFATKYNPTLINPQN